MARILILAAILMSVLACKKPGGQQTANDEATPAGEQPARLHAGEQAENQAEASRVGRVDRAAVQALLDTWLKAQNEQDFATYESLYARRFEGVRRSGSRTVSLGRAGWIADRKRMFKKRMSVEMRDVEIEPFATGAAVRFTQRWASGKYEDIGPKLMVIVLEEGALRIAREEMLSSQLIDAAARNTELADASFAFVIEGDYVVLEPTSQRPAKLELVSEGDPVVVKGKLAASDVPAEVASWKGQRVTDGTCVATIGDFAVIGRVVPHFGTRQEWAGGIEEEGRPYSRRQIAEDAFASSEAVIAGRLETEGGCTMGSFVYEQGNKGPVRANPVSSPALDKAAIRAFRALDSWKEIQREFVEDGQAESEDKDKDKDKDEGGKAGPWDGDSGPTIRAYEHSRTGTILVVVQAQAGAGCGRFFGSLSALFKVKGSLDKPRLELLGEPSLDEVLEVLDIEDDGSFELIVRGGYGGTTVLMSETGESLRVLSIPFLDCGC